MNAAVGALTVCCDGQLSVGKENANNSTFKTSGQQEEHTHAQKKCWNLSQSADWVPRSSMIGCSLA